MTQSGMCEPEVTRSPTPLNKGPTQLPYVLKGTFCKESSYP